MRGGPLPSTFARVQKLKGFMAHNHALRGSIPQFSSTLYVLTLHCNSLHTLPHARLALSVREVQKNGAMLAKQVLAIAES